MDLYNSLLDLSEKVTKFKDMIQNEIQTRNVFVDPFLRILGFDVSNPLDVILECTCDMGTKKGEEVDYALLKDNDVVMLVETKD